MRWLPLVLVIACACGRSAREPEAWLELWEKARDCMLGTEEYGSDVETAYVVASLSRDVRCREQRRALLSIPDTARDRIPGWQALWQELQLVVGDSGPGPIARVDGMADRLRKQLGLSQPTRTRRALPELRSVKQFAGDIVREANARSFLVRSPTESTYVRTPTDVATFPSAPKTVVAFPSRAWSAHITASVLHTTELASGKEVRSTLASNFVVLRAIDQGHARAVLLEDTEGVAVAVSSERGATWRVQRGPRGPVRDVVQDPRTGAIDILTGSHVDSRWYRIEGLAPLEIVSPFATPRFETLIECSSDGVLWLREQRTRATVFRLARDGAQQLALGVSNADAIEDCTGNAALAIGRAASEHALQRCTPTSCNAVLRLPAAEHSAAAFVGTSWVLAAQTGRVVGVWRGDANAPQFFIFDEEGKLAQLVVLDKTPYLLMQSDAHASLVPIPAAQGTSAPW